MDIQLVFGPNNSGKSVYAEDLAVKSRASNLYYLATMIPQTEENHSRIQKHILQRQGKGFQTIEEPWNIHQIKLPTDAVVLLEDASNLLANGIFINHSDYHECYERILTLADHCKKLIIVSITGLVSSKNFDQETNRYIHQLNDLNHLLELSSSSSIKF